TVRRRHVTFPPRRSADLPFQNDQANRIIMRAMAESLVGSLQRTLREDLGGTYGVSARPQFEEQPTGQYRVTISFACDPARMDVRSEEHTSELQSRFDLVC